MSDDVYAKELSFKGLAFHADPEHSFVHGVEFGLLYERMHSGREADIYAQVRAANREVIERACAAEGWSLVVVPTDVDEWIEVKMSKRSKLRHNPSGIRLVK